MALQIVSSLHTSLLAPDVSQIRKCATELDSVKIICSGIKYQIAYRIMNMIYLSVAAVLSTIRLLKHYYHTKTQ